MRGTVAKRIRKIARTMAMERGVSLPELDYVRDTRTGARRLGYCVRRMNSVIKKTYKLGEWKYG